MYIHFLTFYFILSFILKNVSTFKRIVMFFVCCLSFFKSVSANIIKLKLGMDNCRVVICTRVIQVLRNEYKRDKAVTARLTEMEFKPIS